MSTGVALSSAVFNSISITHTHTAGKLVASGCSSSFTFLVCGPVCALAPSGRLSLVHPLWPTAAASQHVFECLPSSFGTLPVASIIELAADAQVAHGGGGGLCVPVCVAH